MRHLGRKEEQKRKQLTPMMRTLHQLICRVFGAWFASQNLQYERQNELAFQVLAGGTTRRRRSRFRSGGDD